MFKYTVNYTDFDNNNRSEDLFFNLSKTEMVLLDNSVPGGLGNRLERISKAADNVEIMETFMWILRKSYGIKSEDGRRFIKSDEIFDEFMQTAAFDEFFTKLTTDEDFAANFIRKIIPQMTDGEWEKIQNKANVIKLEQAKTE